MSRLRNRCVPFSLLVLLAAPAGADTIYRTQGNPVEDCTIVDETLTSVVYKEEGRKTDQAVPSETVLEIRYSKMPALVDQAESSYDQDAPAEALDLFEQYLTEVGDGRKEKQKWAPAYAARRVMEIHMALGDYDKAVEAADRLISRFPDSRYLPDAYLVKSDARMLTGDDERARAALQDFQRVVQSKGLSQRWSLECRLGLAITDTSLQGEKRRDALMKIEADAGKDHPTVVNRARLAIGESLFADGKLDEASKQFQDIVDAGAADARTLAGAYTGLGDCYYERGAKQRDAQALHDATRAYMRVVVLYADQSRYVPRAMFYAARSFHLLGTDEDKERARKLYRAVRSRFRGTKLAEDADNQLSALS